MDIFCITLSIFKQNSIFTSMRLFQIYIYAVYTKLGDSHILCKAKWLNRNIKYFILLQILKDFMC